MFCKNCGRQLPDAAAICPVCGAKRSDGETYADGRSSADIRNLPSYAKEIDRSGHAVDSDRKKFSLSDPDRKKFSLSDSERKRFSLSDSGRDKFSLSDKSRKDDGGGIVRLTGGREKAAQPKETAAQPKEPAAQPKEQTGFVNPLKDSGGTVFRFGDTSGTDVSESVKNAPAASPAKNTPAADPASSVEPEQTSPREPDAVLEGNESPGGFVNPLKDAGLDIQWGNDGDRNQGTDDSGKINSHLRFATWMVILSCTCCNPVTLILGIIAVVFAFQVAVSGRNGDLAIALQKAMVVRTLCWITFGLLSAWILCLVAMFCLPMPEDHSEKEEVIFEENQTEQVEDENAGHSMEQAGDENGGNQPHGENIVKPDRHSSNHSLLREILD